MLYPINYICLIFYLFTKCSKQNNTGDNPPNDNNIEHLRKIIKYNFRGTKVTNNEIELLKKTLLKGSRKEGNDKRYSYSIDYVKNIMKTDNKRLIIIAMKLSSKYKDPINIFNFGKKWYIGLESMRLEYEKDKNIEGTGAYEIESLIKEGVYGNNIKGKMYKL